MHCKADVLVYQFCKLLRKCGVPKYGLAAVASYNSVVIPVVILSHIIISVSICDRAYENSP